MNTLINMKVKVINFIPNAMHDQMDNGAFESYDASEVLIIHPDNLKNGRLIIYHSSQNDSTDKWRQEGVIIKFDINEFLILQGYHIFSSGLQGIEFMQDTDI